MGQSLIWYADSPEIKPFLNEVRKLVDGTRKFPTIKRNKKADPERNAKVEKSAINETTKYFEKLGYSVDSVEKDNVGWDLEVELGKEKLLIEVKGLSGEAVSVGLTPNEYRAFMKKSEAYRLCIVNEALDKPVLRICRFSKESKDWVIEGN